MNAAAAASFRIRAAASAVFLRTTDGSSRAFCSYCSLRRLPWPLGNQAGVVDILTRTILHTSELPGARRETPEPVMFMKMDARQQPSH